MTLDKNNRERVGAAILIVLTSLVWLGYMLFLMPGEPTSDSKRQLVEALSGNYADWKPVAYTCILALMNTLFPGKALGAVYVLQMGCIALSVATIAWYYVKKHVKYAWLILVLPLFFTEKCMLVTTVGNDELAAAAYLLFIAGILWEACIKNVVIRRMVIFFLWCVLVYGMALRQNSVLAIMMLAGWGAWKLGIKKIWKIICFSFAFAFCGVVMNVLCTYHLFKAEQSYPLRFPLASDITNLSILEGEWHPICKMRLQEGDESKPQDVCFLAPDCVNRGGPLSPYIMYEDIALRKRDFEQMKEAWWEMVASHPERYLMMKLFFYHSFLLEGRCIPYLCEKLREAYPHVRIFMERESRAWQSWINREFAVMSVIPIVCYLMLFSCLMKRFRYWVKRSEVRTDAMVFITVAFLYTSSFVMLVQSATEQRYYIIRASLCCVGVVLLLLSMFGKTKKHENAA